MAELVAFYRRAELYDIALRRPVEREVQFLIDLHRQLLGHEPRSALEIACGPGYHARGLARHGVRAIGLDLMAEMVDFAREQAETDGVKVEWLAADMRAFELAEPADMGFALFDAIDSLLTNDEVIQHFRCVARNLSRGGLYVLQLTHPRHTSIWTYGEFSYRGERNGTTVQVDWAVNDPIADPVTQIFDVETRVRVHHNGHEEVFVDRAKERFHTVQDVLLLARLSGAFEPAGFYGDFALDQPLDTGPNSVACIIVLQKLDH